MTYKEIRDHKFKILFMYYLNKTDIDQLILNYFENIPYEEEDDENSYTKDASRTHKNIAKVVIDEDNENVKNVSDAAIYIELTEEDNLNDIKTKIKDIISKTDEIDRMISDNLESWDIKRVGKAELTIIRLALYEIMYTDTPKIVVINEAVELAKKYSDDAVRKMVNAVLDKVIKEVE